MCFPEAFCASVLIFLNHLQNFKIKAPTKAGDAILSLHNSQIFNEDLSWSATSQMPIGIFQFALRLCLSPNPSCSFLSNVLFTHFFFFLHLIQIKKQLSADSLFKPQSPYSHLEIEASIYVRLQLGKKMNTFRATIQGPAIKHELHDVHFLCILYKFSSSSFE